MVLGKRIVIIENDNDIRQIVEIILADQGYQTFSIPEPDKLTTISAFNPDLILLDEFINSKPGHRLCLKIKQTAALNTVPVIILSTANHIELIASECQANDFLRKPFDIDELIAKVMLCINHQPLSY